MKLFFFFFFQAEDGIRDYKVTGVQTCALPIYSQTGKLSAMPQANAQSSAPQVHDLPVQTRAASLVPDTYNEADSTVEVVWTTGAMVRRYDWWNDRPYDEDLRSEEHTSELQSPC